MLHILQWNPFLLCTAGYTFIIAKYELSNIEGEQEFKQTEAIIIYQRVI